VLASVLVLTTVPNPSITLWPVQVAAVARVPPRSLQWIVAPAAVPELCEALVT
jgi:hypothetical protein